MSKERKPSDFPIFCATVYAASATVLDFEQYFEYYRELLQVLWWNYDIDTAIELDRLNVEFVEPPTETEQLTNDLDQSNLTTH